MHRYAGPELRQALLLLFEDCWTQGYLPQCFKDVCIIAIYKRKGDRKECRSYRRISLLSVAGKLLVRILLLRLRTLAEKIPESKYSNRSSRSTTDIIFTLRQLQKKAVEQQSPLFILFVDFRRLLILYIGIRCGSFLSVLDAPHYLFACWPNSTLV